MPIFNLHPVLCAQESEETENVGFLFCFVSKWQSQQACLSGWGTFPGQEPFLQASWNPHPWVFMLSCTTCSSLHCTAELACTLPSSSLPPMVKGPMVPVDLKQGPSVQSRCFDSCPGQWARTGTIPVYLGLEDSAHITKGSVHTTLNMAYIHSFKLQLFCAYYMPSAVLHTRTQSLLSDVNGSNMGKDEVITLPMHLVYDQFTVLLESFSLRAVMFGDELIVQGVCRVKEEEERDLNLIYYVKMILALCIAGQPFQQKM